MRSKIFLAAISSVICGCSGGGHDAASSCTTIGSNVNSLTAGGSVDNLQAAADGNLGSFATLTTQAAGNYVTSKGVSFPGGSNAGVFITPPKGATAADITVSTFQTQEQATVESATGPTLTLTPTNGDPAAEYASFKTTAPFNGVRLTVNASGATQYLVFEICGAADVK